MKVVLATSNKGKIEDIQSMLWISNLNLRPQSEYGVKDAEETGLTFVENALIKARNACSATGLPAIAEDSGLVVPALDGTPGLYSARYAGKGASADSNMDLLLDQMKGMIGSKRNAYFHSTMVYLRYATDPSPLIAFGNWHGRIAHSKQGRAGFGYDPIFNVQYIPGIIQTAAELSQETRNMTSHRAKATESLIDMIMEEKNREISY